jgi:ABC-type lipoprotein release transport system permease subunit
MDYSIKFNATTSGKGRFKLRLDGCRKTSSTDEKIRAYKGASPLVESQWMLQYGAPLRQMSAQRIENRITLSSNR